MIKQATFFKRRPDLEPAAFHDYWRNRHPEFVCRLPGLKRYVQNHAIADDGPFDGIAEVWFEDMDAMRANAGAPELDAVRADEANFLDTAGMGGIIADEHVIKDGAPDGDAEKLMALVFRQEQHAPERFFELYRDELGGLVRAVSGIPRYEQAHCRMGIYRSGRTPACDAVASLWIADRERTFTSPEMARVGAFEGTIIDFERTRVGFVEEIEIPL